MKIYRCRELLELTRHDKEGNRTDRSISVTPGMSFTAGDDPGDPVRLEGLRGMRLSISRQTLEKHFEELA